MKECLATTKKYLLPHLVKQTFFLDFIQSDHRKCLVATKRFHTVQPKVNVKNTWWPLGVFL